MHFKDVKTIFLIGKARPFLRLEVGLSAVTFCVGVIYLKFIHSGECLSSVVVIY